MRWLLQFCTDVRGTRIKIPSTSIPKSRFSHTISFSVKLMVQELSFDQNNCTYFKKTTFCLFLSFVEYGKNIRHS